MAEAVHPPAHILIVDDEPQVRSVLHELFSEDHKCVEAASAEESLELLRGEQFDYITKPFDLQQVRMAVGRALDYRALREAKRRYEADLEELVRRRTAELDHVSLHDAVTGKREIE